MKKKSFASFLVILLLLFFGSDVITDGDLLRLFSTEQDTNAPLIDDSAFPTTIALNTELDYTLITCEDDVDTTCTISVTKAADTSILGEQFITVTAKDSYGNIRDKSITITVVTLADPSSHIPLGYYDSITGLSGIELKNALNDIITGHIEFPYTSSSTDVWDILREADEDPNNPENVLTLYTNQSIPKDCQDSNSIPTICKTTINGSTTTLVWNREHVWSKSRGDFSIKPGTTSVKAMGPNTDAHHLVAEEKVMNSTKSNRLFEDCHDGDDTNVVDRGFGNYTCNEWEFEPRDDIKGDVARMIFYMAVRYEGEEGDMVDLEVLNDVVESQGSKLPYYGDLDDLIRWHLEDPVSEKEILRNNVIYSYQGNRNPFIDLPHLVELIWGN